MKHYTLARPYAKAAYLFAVDANKVEAWAGFLGQMAELLSDETLRHALKHPQFKVQQLIDVAVEKLGDEDGGHFQNFLRLLAEKHRLGLLPEIHELFLEDVKKGTECRAVLVKSAFKLSKSEIKALETQLTKQFKQTVDLNVVEDASLIGGMIIESGDYVQDGSLSGQLQRLKQNLTL